MQNGLSESKVKKEIGRIFKKYRLNMRNKYNENESMLSIEIPLFDSKISISYKVKPVSSENDTDSNCYTIEPPQEITSHNKYGRTRYIGFEEARKQIELLHKHLENIPKAMKETEDYLKEKGILKA